MRNSRKRNKFLYCVAVVLYILAVATALVSSCSMWFKASRPGAAAVRPAQLRSVSRRQLLLDCRPLRSYRKLLSRLLILRQRRFPELHRLSLRQLLSAPCHASSNTVPAGNFCPSASLTAATPCTPGNVLRTHRPRCSVRVRQLRSWLIQQRQRCDVSLHDVPAGTVPGHGNSRITRLNTSR